MGFVRPPTCRECGKLAKTTKGAFGFYHECCGMASWNGKPLVTKATLAARQAAHRAFDPLWKDGLLTRTEAYAILAQKLGIPLKKCHMSIMDEATAWRVVVVAKEILRERSSSTSGTSGMDKNPGVS